MMNASLKFQETVSEDVDKFREIYQSFEELYINWTKHFGKCGIQCIS